MIRKFSFINLKGGTGKTFFSRNTAYILSQIYGRKTLLIDNDKQGNASDFFDATDADSTIADLFLGNKSIRDVIQKTKYSNLDIIAADMQLLDANMSVLKNSDCKQYTILKNALSEVEDEYDFCVIDNPPDINISVFNALLMTDEVIIVTTPDEDSMSGVDKMLKQIDMAKKYDSNLACRGVLMNKFISASSCYEYKDKSKYNFFNTNIHLATRVAIDKLIQSRKKKIPILEFAPNCKISRELVKFVNELLYIK